jgi:hypothetical protein
MESRADEQPGRRQRLTRQTLAQKSGVTGLPPPRRLHDVAFQYIGSLEDYVIRPNERGGFNLWRFVDWSRGGWIVVCRGTREALGLELLKRFGLEPDEDQRPVVVMATLSYTDAYDWGWG